MAIREKVIRDPVHDVIAFNLDKSLDRLLFRLINAAEFQRLRRIRQLGMAHLAYPGADHSRYSHSIGVMQTARRMLAALANETHIDDDQRTVCTVAALLHDTGHGPFSHVFERVTGVHHEAVTRRVILDDASEINRLLAEHDPALPALVVAALGADDPSVPAPPASGGRNFTQDILSSQLDADRFDYLLRDNLMTGARYGAFDLSWLLHALTIESAGGRLAVKHKAVSAIEAYLQARYHMYRNVYFHKVVRAAEGMVKLALQRARRLAVQERLDWPPRESAVQAALLGQRLDATGFLDMDDVSVLQCLKVWARSDDTTLAALSRGLLFRGLYKTIDLSALSPEAGAIALAAAHEAVRSVDADVDYDLFYDEPADTPYTTYDPNSPHAGKGEIIVVDPVAGIRDFAQISPMSHAMSRQLMFRRIHVAEPLRDLVAKAVRKATS